MRIALLIALCFAAACHPSYGQKLTRPYQPLPLWEARFATQANRKVLPADVRKHRQEYAKTLVAWVGVITDIKTHQEGASSVVALTAQHHYFDWIENSRAWKVPYLLSSRGEGTFAAAWRMDTPKDRQFIGQFAVGDMIVAYGYPSGIRGGVVGLATENLRAIKPNQFSTALLDYGRSGRTAKASKESPQ